LTSNSTKINDPYANPSAGVMDNNQNPNSTNEPAFKLTVVKPKQIAGKISKKHHHITKDIKPDLQRELERPANQTAIENAKSTTQAHEKLKNWAESVQDEEDRIEDKKRERREKTDRIGTYGCFTFALISIVCYILIVIMLVIVIGTSYFDLNRSKRKDLKDIEPKHRYERRYYEEYRPLNMIQTDEINKN